MVIAYLLINTKPGAETKVAEELIKKKEIKDISIVYGAYDLVVKIKVKTMDELQKFILGMRVDIDVEQTSTLISTDTK